MKAWDVLHHETQVNNNRTLKPIQLYVLGFSAQTLQVHMLEWPMVKHSNKAGGAYERTLVLQHYQVELTIRLDQVLWRTEQHNFIVEYVPCWIHVQVHRNRQTMISQEIDGIKRWWPSWTMLPDMTHINWNNTLRFTGIPGCTLMKRRNHNQDTETYVKLLHKLLKIWKTWKSAQYCNSTNSNQSI